MMDLVHVSPWTKSFHKKTRWKENFWKKKNWRIGTSFFIVKLVSIQFNFAKSDSKGRGKIGSSFSYFCTFAKCLKITKKSHSTLRAKRAKFTFWVDKSSFKMPKKCLFWRFFENLKFASNSVTRQVTFKKDKIGEKFKNENSDNLATFDIL